MLLRQLVQCLLLVRLLLILLPSLGRGLAIPLLLVVQLGCLDQRLVVPLLLILLPSLGHRLAVPILLVGCLGWRLVVALLVLWSWVLLVGRCVELVGS